LLSAMLRLLDDSARLHANSGHHSEAPAHLDDSQQTLTAALCRVTECCL